MLQEFKWFIWILIEIRIQLNKDLEWDNLSIIEILVSSNVTAKGIVKFKGEVVKFLLGVFIKVKIKKGEIILNGGGC